MIEYFAYVAHQFSELIPTEGEPFQMETDWPLFTQGCFLIILGLVPVILWFIDHRRQAADAKQAAIEAQEHEEEQTAKIARIVEEVLKHDEQMHRDSLDAAQDARDSEHNDDEDARQHERDRVRRDGGDIEQDKPKLALPDAPTTPKSKPEKQ